MAKITKEDALLYHESGRPGKIEVELLRDGEVIDEVELNNETGWEYDWED